MHDAEGDTQVTEDELAAMAAIMQSHMNVRQDEMQGMMGNGYYAPFLVSKDKNGLALNFKHRRQL